MAAQAVDHAPMPAAGWARLRVAPAGVPVRAVGAVVRLRATAPVYRRRRAAVGAAAMAVLAAVGMGLASGDAPPALTDAPAGTVAPATVVVGPGETLWDLVAAHTPAGAHPMAYAVEVAAYNDIDPRTVTPGTVVRLPPVGP